MVLSIVTLVFALMSVPSPSAELELMRRSGTADTQQVAEAVEAGLTKLAGTTPAEQCMDAFLAGEIYRRADAIAPGKGYDTKAIEKFRAMRIDYMDQAAGLMGYIGEARLHRQHGEPEEAISALAPLLDTKADPRIRQVALLEALEAQLLIDPREALAQAGELGTAADWVRARAYAAIGDTDSALNYARSEPASTACPAFDRLAFIAKQGTLETDERSGWAQELAAVGRVDEALEVLGETGTEGTAQLHAELLQRAGRYEQALTHWRRAIGNGVDDKARFMYAVCLESAAANDQVDKANTLRTQAIKAYETVVTSGDDETLRRDALRRWFYLWGAKAPRVLIDTHIELIDSDPYLRYARLRILQPTLEAGEITAELTDIIELAESDGLRAAVVLTLIDNQQNPRAALSTLDEHWALLTGQPSTAPSAMHIRTKLWIGLGMTDRAVKELLADLDAQPPGAILLTASALADRYADGIQVDTQRQVIQLAAAAMRQAPSDESIALESAELMLRVDARADAVSILGSLNSPEARCLSARALRELGRTDEAIERVAGLHTPAASLERSYCYLRLERFDEALIDARAARTMSPEGDDLWWHATLALARAYLAQGETTAAGDVLRVAEVMYPAQDRPGLMDAIKLLKKELNG